MKLIIDIPEEIYKASQIIDVKYEDTIQIPFEVVANGIPLDKIRAEIAENGNSDINTQTVLSIIDHYREGERK